MSNNQRIKDVKEALRLMKIKKEKHKNNKLVEITIEALEMLLKKEKFEISSESTNPKWDEIIKMAEKNKFLVHARGTAAVIATHEQQLISGKGMYFWDNKC